jgi:hypothetical protein
LNVIDAAKASSEFGGVGIAAFSGAVHMSGKGPASFKRSAIGLVPNG